MSNFELRAQRCWCSGTDAPPHKTKSRASKVRWQGFGMLLEIVGRLLSGGPAGQQPRVRGERSRERRPRGVPRSSRRRRRPWRVPRCGRGPPRGGPAAWGRGVSPSPGCTAHPEDRARLWAANQATRWGMPSSLLPPTPVVAVVHRPDSAQDDQTLQLQTSLRLLRDGIGADAEKVTTFAVASYHFPWVPVCSRRNSWRR